MKTSKVLVFILTFWLIPSIMLGLPSLSGNRGLFRVQDARVEGTGMLSVSTHILTSSTTTAGSTSFLAGLIPAIGYSPTIFLEFYGHANFFKFVSWSGKVYDIYTGKVDMSVGTDALGSKLSAPWLPILKLGGTSYYTFAQEKFGWNGLATLQLSEIQPAAPNLIFNYGGLIDTAFKNLGVGLELAARNLSLVIEANSEQSNPESALISNGAAMRITPGLRFRNSSLAVDFGLSIGLTPVVPNYEIIFGLSFLTPFLQPAKPPVGTIAGRVTDSRTGEPLEATINFPDLPKVKSVTSNPNTGIFTAEKIPAGVVVVEVTKNGYFKEALPITIKADGVTSYEFKLKPLVTYGVLAGKIYDITNNRPLRAVIAFPGTDIPSVDSDSATGSFRIDRIPVGIITIQAEKEGYFKNAQTVQIEEGKITTADLGMAPVAFKSILTGKVSDKKTGKPVAATISFPGAGLGDVTVDSTTGIYKVELPVGSHPVELKAEGYITQTAIVILEKDKITEKNFELVQKGMVITLKGVNFDFNKATIRPESYPVLDDAAKILADNPKIMVEIQGHTDSEGSDSYNQKLSEQRAYAVVDYLVKVKGIDSNRLKAVGYGESKPIAPNATKEGRALNRRVEFVILGEVEQK